jgi:glycosyltransferase involved in cell wall biosynthesis
LPDTHLLLVGGGEEDRARLRNLEAFAAARDRIRFQDQVPPDEVPLYLRAADVLVLPNSGRFAISRHYTSPMKLFEYMAAGRPMVASDLPSLREVLNHEENALLVPPEDPKALAQAIIRLLTDPSLKDRLVASAAGNVIRYGWPQRAMGILEFMKTRTEGNTP